MLQSICEPLARCKCCNGVAPLYGVVDLNKNCEIVRQRVLPCSGVPIYYYRCSDCSFIFTPFFDSFTLADFARVIYNDDYLLVDPDYVSARPNANAALLQQIFSASKPNRLLDFGGGNGTLARLLSANGFAHVDCYDPYIARYSQKPPQKYDCIVSFEVFEHLTDPISALTDLNDLLADPGLVMFSTLLQPANIDQIGLNWWYAAPRNGHVSLYSRESLSRLAQRFGLELFSFNQNFHLLFRNPPHTPSIYLTDLRCDSAHFRQIAIKRKLKALKPVVRADKIKIFPRAPNTPSKFFSRRSDVVLTALATPTTIYKWRERSRGSRSSRCTLCDLGASAVSHSDRGE